MNKNFISDLELIKNKNAFTVNEDITVSVKFSLKGTLRDSFTEENWTKAYNKNDNLFKLKYDIKLTSGGLRKREIGKPLDTYRKASLFWTRNPKLVNPMKERRIWVQVAKNFEPFIRLSEEEVKHELFDFDENIVFKASEIGSGNHKIGAEVCMSWQKHDYTEPDNVKDNAKEIEIKIN
ncbi:MAG: hypothetical protein AABX15_03520 [Thermoproteota archaeon]